ncbi:hypothetical protein PanWU01x14_352170 [Parasponia andersonii]|uniref:Mitochondrial inner membrane translocase subunit n=1 Tax=Parasponia andersonii TaxID=3476 RepID=A0A2P5AAG0_PARAD|nr:hypothetical protein PanWU01x14_352170 [Parasponia andersonii]
MQWILQKNAMIGGALTGAVVSIASSNDKDNVLVNAITGGAIAIAAEFYTISPEDWNQDSTWGLFPDSKEQ